MTTAAWDGETLAIDSAVWADDILSERRDKFMYGRRFVLAPAGEVKVAKKMFEWLNRRQNIDRIELMPSFTERDDAVAMVLRDDGTAHYLMSDVGYYDELTTPWAIGHGMTLAFGAMFSGASAEAAVIMACERNPYTRGPVNSVTVKDLKAKK